MSKYPIRLFTLASFATSLLLVAAISPADAATSNSRHVKKHHQKMHMGRGNSYPRSGVAAWSVTRPSAQTGEVCHGIARSFDCSVWPPPMDEDPDRKISGTDGGG
jgi:hypothetical protein